MTVDPHDESYPGNANRASWLPPRKRGNGFDAPAWAPIADVPENLVDHLLNKLATADVPAFAGPVDGRRTGRSYRLWVGSRRYAIAQDVLRREVTGGWTSAAKAAASRPPSPNTNTPQG